MKPNRNICKKCNVEMKFVKKYNAPSFDIEELECPKCGRKRNIQVSRK